MIPGYSKIWSLGDRNTDDLFKDEIEITEKIDGSQFSFGVVNGHLHMRSKKVPVHPGDGNKMFNKAVEFALTCEQRNVLPEGFTFHGEYMQSKRHNTLEYGAIPLNGFMLYGVRQPGGKLVSDYDVLEKWAVTLGCDPVPLLYRGRIEDAPGYTPDTPFDWFKTFIDRESALGIAKMEGVVIKNYHRDLLVGGQYIPLIAGKFVSEQFKEKHGVAWKVNNPSSLERVGQMIRSEARWVKAVQHLRDSGELTGTVKDIGPVLKEINRDILEEETENLKDELWRVFKKDVMRIAVSGFPEWYKVQLCERALGEVA